MHMGLIRAGVWLSGAIHHHLFTSLQHVQTGSEQLCVKVATLTSSISLRFRDDVVDLASQNCPARGEEIKSISLRIQHTQRMTHMDSVVARHSENGPSSRILPPFTLCVRDSLPGWGVYEDLVLGPYGAFTGDFRPAAVMSVWSFINVIKANDEEIH